LRIKNPKDSAANHRLPLDVVPSAVQVLSALANAEGAAKYGPYNWRKTPVLFSVYLGAIGRHLALLQNGEWEDPISKVPHLASLIANAGIIADARFMGMLVDDRGASNPELCNFIRESEELVEHIRRTFQRKDKRRGKTTRKSRKS